MPTWVLALQLAIGLLQAAAPEIEAAIAAASAQGQDLTPHTNAQNAVTNAIAGFNQAIAGAVVPTKPAA